MIVGEVPRFDSVQISSNLCPQYSERVALREKMYMKTIEELEKMAKEIAEKVKLLKKNIQKIKKK